MIFHRVLKGGRKIAMAVLLLMILCCLWASFFLAGGKPSGETLHPFVLLLGTVVYVGALIAAERFLARLSRAQLGRIAAGLLALYAAGLAVSAAILRSIPTTDLMYVHIEAVNMLDTGRIANTVYFGTYPNNEPVAVLLYFVYAVSRFLGLTDYRLAGTLFGALVMFLSAALLYGCGCARSRKCGVLALLLYVTNPVFYLYVSHYYTDILCLPFMLGGAVLFMRAGKRRSMGGRILSAAGSAALLYAGYKIRPTVLILLVAIVLILLLRIPRRRGAESLKSKLLPIFAGLFGGLLVGWAVCGALLAAHGLEEVHDRAMPPTHWLMMGLNQEANGGFTGADSNYTRNFSTYEEKVQGNLTVIRQRIHDLGIGGLARLSVRKMARAWTDGTNLYRTYLSVCERYGRAYEYTAGGKSLPLMYIAQIMRCGLFLLLVPVVIRSARRREDHSNGSLLLIAVFGAFLFYLFWEVLERYSLSFLPLLFLCAADGIDLLAQARFFGSCSLETTDGRRSVRTRRDLFRIAQSGLAAAVVLTAFAAGANARAFAGETGERAATRVNQRIAKITLPIGDTGVEQTFAASRPFNAVSVHFQNKGGQTVPYRFALLDGDGNLLAQQDFTSVDMKDNQYTHFRFETVRPDGDETYRILLTCGGSGGPLSVSASYAKPGEAYRTAYDYYPGGELRADGAPVGSDLQFAVKLNTQATYIPRRVYALLCAGVFAMEALLYVLLLRYRSREGLRG